MFDWIFGSNSKKDQPSKQVKESKPLEKWIYNYICQYLVSPIFRSPLMDLIQSNCIRFEDTEQNKFEYTKVFQQFVGLAALLIESMLQETGISEQHFQECMKRGLAHPRDSSIFKQVLVCDNFQVFKRMMISKNKELELQAMEELEGKSNKIDQLTQEKNQVQAAIAISLALQGKVDQDKELEEAIRESLKIYEESNTHASPNANTQNTHTLTTNTTHQLKENKKHELPPLVIAPKKNYDRPIEENIVEEKKIQAEIAKIKENIPKEEKILNKQGEEQRRKRLQEQRELIMKKKQEARKEQLHNFVQNTESIPQNKLTEEELQRRKKLMQKLREQLKE